MATPAQLFEPSSPLGRRLAGCPPDQVIARARALLDVLTEEERVATLAAHPRIGERPERMSERSRREQGEDRLPELDGLNDEYERRFGFRFVTFVNGRAKPELVDELRARLERSRSEEMAAGLEAIISIAEARLRP